MNQARASSSGIFTESIPSNGTHIIANLTSDNVSLLVDYHEFKVFIDDLISSLKLTNIGEVYHNFETGGFTAVICLSESHLSIHTWPERNYITFDVFLSNFLRDNSSTTMEIFEKTVSFLEATVLDSQTIHR